MSLRRGRPRAELNAEINVVSLIDVMMLLLVIFMITAPMMQGGIEVNLPQADGRPLESRTSLTVTVTRDAIFVDQDRLSDAEFRAAFKALASDRVKDGVFVRSDASITAQRLLSVLSMMRDAGVEAAGIVTRPVEGDGR